jgi:Arylsulfotransferase (ASST)
MVLPTAALLLAALVGLSVNASGGAVAEAQGPPVSVFPIPGGRLAAPRTQITFRGIPASAIGSISVTGSRTGAHAGVIEADSDGRGGSFIPSQPFSPGETVTVVTSLNVLGARNGTFQFQVATPAGQIPEIRSVRVGRVRGDVWSFHSRPDLAPAAVRVSHRGAAGGADIFLSPQFGPVQNGPEIVDRNGNLIWFNPVPSGQMAANFRVQRYRGQPVLTWWQGYSDAGMGIGEDLIYDSSYRQIAVVQAGNGLSADLHEFQITPAGTALISAYFPVYWDATSVHGLRQEIVFDSVVQEIDIPTGLVLFQWDSLDHVPLSDSYQPPPPEGRKVGLSNPYDYFHLDSIQLDRDGDLLIAARNTWAVYKLNRQTGALMWGLGGKRSSFRLSAGAAFAFEHDAISQGRSDRYITLFDDGAGLPAVHNQSRGLELALDFKRRTARVYRQWVHSPPLLSEFEGNLQPLPRLDQFIGWGQQPYFSEYGARGRQILDGRFISNTSSYRAYSFTWRGTPAAPPAVAASVTAAKVTLYVSWNGATGVASWRVLGGSSSTGRSVLTTARKTSFETAITVPTAPYETVEALDSAGRPLASSPTLNIG